MSDHEHTNQRSPQKTRRDRRQIEHLQDNLRQLVIALDNLDATIHLFDPSIELGEIRKRPVPPRLHAFRG
jgi:hypothetical protein